MRVVVDRDRCEGNGQCVLAAPDIFQLREDDQSYVLVTEVTEEMRPRAEAAVRTCPRQAITLVEE